MAYGLKSWNEWGKGDGTYQHDIYHISRAGTTFPNLLNIYPSHYVVFWVFFFFFFNFIYLFLTMLGLLCCTWVLSSCSERGYSPVVLCGFLIAGASLVVEHRR